MTQKIFDFLKKYWLFILLGAIVAILSILFSIKKPSLILPPTTIIPTPASGPIDQPQFNFSQPLNQEINYKISLTLDYFKQFPQSLPIYKTKFFTKEEILGRFNEIINEFGFINQPKEKQIENNSYLTWTNQENFLRIITASGQFLFSGQLPLTSNLENQQLNADQIQKIVKEKLIFWNLISENTTVDKILGYNIAGPELIPTNKKQAEVFRLSFKSEFNSLPLIGLGLASNLIEVKINNQGVLTYLVFNLHQIEKEKLDDYPLKTFSEVQSEIKKGKMEIIQVLTLENQEYVIPSLKEIQEVQVDSLEIGYYETTEAQKYYQPIFLLKGNLILKNNQKFQSLFLLPAIASEWLTPEL